MKKVKIEDFEYLLACFNEAQELNALDCQAIQQYIQKNKTKMTELSEKYLLSSWIEYPDTTISIEGKTQNFKDCNIFNLEELTSDIRDCQKWLEIQKGLGENCLQFTDVDVSDRNRPIITFYNTQRKFYQEWKFLRERECAILNNPFDILQLNIFLSELQDFIVKQILTILGFYFFA